MPSRTTPTAGPQTGGRPPPGRPVFHNGAPLHGYTPSMSEAKKGDTVRVHYTGRLGDGSEFDSSTDGDPLEFTIGEQQVIPGFEKAVVGMSPGQTKTETIVAANAYGEYHPDHVFKVDRGLFPEHITPETGMRLMMSRPDSGEGMAVTVKSVAGEEVTLDANHPLAGKDLTFEIKLVEIVAA